MSSRSRPGAAVRACGDARLGGELPTGVEELRGQVDTDHPRTRLGDLRSVPHEAFAPSSERRL